MSPRRPLLLLAAAPLLLGGVACSDVADRVDELRASAEDASESVEFCLSLARAATAMESSSPETAATAAEEVLVHAPEEVREDARTIVDILREAEDRREALDDPELRDAVERLRDRTRELCDPR